MLTILALGKQRQADPWPVILAYMARVRTVRGPVSKTNMGTEKCFSSQRTYCSIRRWESRSQNPLFGSQMPTLVLRDAIIPFDLHGHLYTHVHIHRHT